MGSVREPAYLLGRMEDLLTRFHHAPFLLPFNLRIVFHSLLDQKLNIPQLAEVEIAFPFEPLNGLLQLIILIRHSRACCSTSTSSAAAADPASRPCYYRIRSCASPRSRCGSGVLVREDGRIEALWLSYLGERSPSSSKNVEYHLGLATPVLRPVLEQLEMESTPDLRMTMTSSTFFERLMCRLAVRRLFSLGNSALTT